MCLTGILLYNKKAAWTALSTFRITHLHASIWLQWFMCKQALDWTSSDCAPCVPELVTTIYDWQPTVSVLIHVEKNWKTLNKLWLFHLKQLYCLSSCGFFNLEFLLVFTFGQLTPSSKGWLLSPNQNSTIHQYKRSLVICWKWNVRLKCIFFYYMQHYELPKQIKIQKDKLRV